MRAITVPALPTAPTGVTPPTVAPSPIPPTPTPQPTPVPALARQNNPCGFEAIANARVVWIAVAAPLTGTDSDKGVAMVRAACLTLKNLRDNNALPEGLKVDDVVKIAPALRKQFPNVPIVVTDASDSPKLRTLAIDELYVSTMAMPTDRLGEFGADFAAFTGIPLAQIPAYTAESYDATLICLKAIERAGTDPTTQTVYEAWKGNPAINEGYPLNSQTGPYSYDGALNLSEGGTYFISNGVGTTVAKYKCAETPGGGCVKKVLPTLP